MSEQCKREIKAIQARLLDGIRLDCIEKYGNQVLDKTTPALINNATGGKLYAKSI